MDQGFIIIERDIENIWKNLIHEIREPLTFYRGFDGNSWSYEEFISEYCLSILEENNFGMCSMQYYKNFGPYISKLKESNVNFDILFLNRKPINSFNLSDFKFVGYDIGIIEEFNEPTFFSILLNEVRKKGNERLEPFYSELNQYYLCDKITIAEKLIEERKIAFNENNTSFLETCYSHNDIEIVGIYLKV